MRLFLFSARARSPLSALLPPSLIFDHTATHACPPAPACPRCYRVDLMMVLAQHHPSKPNATAHRSQTAARARKARRLLPVPHRPIGVGRGCALRSFYASPNLRIQLHSTPASLRLQACRPGAKEFHCNGPCHKFVPHVVAVWLLRRSLPGTATAAAEADHGERDWDVDLKPGSSGYDAALASCNPSSERALSNQTIFWRPN